MLELSWGTCGDNGSWCGFLDVNLNHSNFDGKNGVYIIWQGRGPIIKVGQGAIRDQLIEARNNEEITRFENLFVTWASVETQDVRGVMRFLTEILNPRIESNGFEDAVSIAVNPPWRRS